MFQNVMIIILSTLLAGASLLIAWLVIRARRNVRSDMTAEDPWTRTDPQMLKLMEAGNLVLTQYDHAGRLTWISPEIKRITGISSTDFISKKSRISDLVHPEDAKALEGLDEGRRNRDEESRSIDCRIQDRRGNWHWLHIHQRQVTRNGSIVGHESLAVDYTALAELESQKKRAGELQNLSTMILESFLATDDTRSTLNWNLEAIGQSLQIREATIHDLENSEGCLLTGSWSSQKDDHSALTARSLGEGETSDLKELLETPTPLRFGGDSGIDKERIRPLSKITEDVSGVVVPVRVLGSLSLILTFIRDPHNPWKSDEISALQLIAQSISRRLEREHAVQERSQFDEIIRGHERSEIIAHLASGIAHDFNNIVFAISGRIQLLQRRSEDSRMNDSLAEIQTTLQGAKGIIGALLAMHRGSQRPSGRVRIGPETKAVMTMIRRLTPRRIELSLDTSDINDLEVELGAESLHQILMNLVINARDAIDNTGRISIKMARATDDAGEPLIAIDIDDDGPGIPESMRAEVFKPFVSSKPSNRGTGLGLSIVQRVLKEYGGDIRLLESPLGGLRAHIEVRVANNSHEPTEDGKESNSSTPVPEVRLEKVLIVEDDETIKTMLTRFFESIGTEVTALNDARDVEALLRETTPPFDALVMDIDLPYKTGVECVTEIRGQGIETPCVLITGGLSERPDDISNLGFLRKPFEIDELESLCKSLICKQHDS